jgi:DNA-binding CsgD family transcriptional regulator
MPNIPRGKGPIKRAARARTTPPRKPLSPGKSAVSRASPVANPGFSDDVHRLWDELADFGLSATHNASIHCMRTICTWIGAQSAFWAGIVRVAQPKMGIRDTLSGWRIGAIDYIDPHRVTPQLRWAGLKDPETSEPGETSRAVVAGAGRFRVHSLGTGVVDMESFQKTAHYDYFYRQRSIADRIWVAFPVNAHAESVFCFDTVGNGRNFTDDELQRAALALRGIKWFHRLLLLGHGLGIGATPLQPAERRLVPELLSGASEKTIARRLTLTPATVHQYATAIYRKYGVRGRNEFMSLWLHHRV